MRKVILSAESTCDIGAELQQKYNVHFFRTQIALEGEIYIDGQTITPEDIYKAWWDVGVLPKTTAITPADYEEKFREWEKDGYDIVHLNLGSGISASYQNCRMLAEEMTCLYPIDSQSLSTGFGLLVIAAGEMIEQGFSAPEIQKKINEMHTKTNASFILDTLEFMKAGGRCSSVAAFGANLLKLRPQISVNNQDGGKMAVGKKYRGDMEKVLKSYVQDQLQGKENLDVERIFITHSGSPQSDIDLVKQEIKKYADFKNVTVTQASCTISAHCGPRTLGILYLNK